MKRHRKIQLGDDLATHKVNLDALIIREDFESGAEAQSSSSGISPIFKIPELHRDSMYYRLLRKPDFQRETNNWEPETIVDFVECFLDNKL
ncbi:MAG TPA: hypothetical protein VG097_16840, partial [Gemmata sp.]|nr:hypothetical protein [Gemmata sp.]